ncbi:MAG: restriction endonuclease subunit S [Lachnospirales bacterium]
MKNINKSKNYKKKPALRFIGFEKNLIEYTLGEIAEINDGTHFTPNYVKRGVPFYSAENIINKEYPKKFITTSAHRINSKRIKVEKDDIFFTRLGNIGISCVYELEEEADFYVSLALIKSNKEIFNSYFLSCYINSTIFKKELNKRILRIAFPVRINIKELRKCRVFLPNIVEQEKISELFKNFNKLIELNESKLNYFILCRKAILQKKFTNKEKNNSEKILGDICNEVNERNDKWIYKRVLSLSKSRGVIEQKEQFTREVASKDLRKYKVIKKGMFAFNPTRVDGGAINQLVNYEDGVLSSTYVVFEASWEVNTEYLQYFFQSSAFKNKVPMYMEGCVRNALSYKSFSKIKLTFPSLKEQEKIVELIKIMDKKISLQKELIKLLEKEKVAIAQKMLI